MLCPFCGAEDDKVIDSRAADTGRVIRRRRQCNACGRRFTTYERIEEAVKLMVVKKDGSRVPYNRAKLIRGIEQACYKRRITAEQIAALVDSVEEAMFKQFEREVEAMEIGRLVSDRLKELDQVAYVRFASVYKQFRDLDDLLEEVRDVMTKPRDTKDQGKLF
jgi:transcriptional repressor NrdR